MNSRFLFAVAALSIIVACSTGATAAVPQTLSYQGVLRDDVGGAVPDGSYESTFSVYNLETGGAALWTESQTLTVTSGVFFAVLGSVTPLDLPFDEQYWLGISVAGEPQLAPRVPLTAVPYAHRAAYADAGDDGDWTISGDNVYHLVGDVGIGTATPLVDLEIRRDQDAYTGMVITNTDTGINSREGIIFKNEDGETAGLQLYDEGSPVGAGMVLSNNRPNGYLRFTTGEAERMRVGTDGRVGIGVLLPSQLLDVAGTVRAEGFEMPTGATAGHILTSDAVGNGAWTAPPSLSDDDWTISGNNMSADVSGNVGIGTSVPQDKLEVKGAIRLDSGAGNANIIRFVDGGDMKWAFLYRPWVDGNLTILDEVSSARSMTFESGTGDVGIKTEHPETDLHVVGDTQLDGSLVVNGSITQAAATQHYTVQAADFVAHNPGETRYGRTAETIYTDSGIAVSFAAPVHLPQGATIVSVTHYFVDNSAQDSACNLGRFSFPGSANNQIADVPSSGSSGAGSTMDATPTWPVIDNTAYTYSVLLTARDGIETESVAIEYTTTTVD